MVLRGALARVVGHGEHSLTPGDMNGNRDRMKIHHAARAHVRPPTVRLPCFVENNVAHGEYPHRNAQAYHSRAFSQRSSVWFEMKIVA
jgi:hypothetical protein